LTITVTGQLISSVGGPKTFKIGIDARNVVVAVGLKTFEVTGPNNVFNGPNTPKLTILPIRGMFGIGDVSVMVSPRQMADCEAVSVSREAFCPVMETTLVVTQVGPLLMVTVKLFTPVVRPVMVALPVVPPVTAMPAGPVTL
jgi:hypothetical protein